VAVARFWLAFSGRAAEFADQLPGKHEAGYRALDAMERHLASRTFLVCERYTVADVSLYAYTHVAHEGGFDLAGHPAIRAWLDRVAGQPGHVTIDA
jgi:glutathione S-transferase